MEIEVEDDGYTSREGEGERALFCAVILVAVQDARSPVPEKRDDVRRWLDHDDFRVICELAGQDRQTVYRAISRFLDSAPKPRKNATSPEKLEASRARIKQRRRELAAAKLVSTC